MKFEAVVRELQARSDDEVLDEQGRVGIEPGHAIGISVTELRAVAKGIDPDHELALRLWDTGIHEARFLATMIDEESKVTDRQLERWIADVASWDLCDQFCTDLLTGTPLALEKADQWLDRDEEFVKRAGFVLIAKAVVHDDRLTDDECRSFLDSIACRLDDDRHYVKKGASWALREIGKRNQTLRTDVLELTDRLLESESTPTQWVARDVRRELA